MSRMRWRPRATTTWLAPAWCRKRHLDEASDDRRGQQRGYLWQPKHDADGSSNRIGSATPDWSPTSPSASCIAAPATSATTDDRRSDPGAQPLVHRRQPRLRRVEREPERPRRDRPVLPRTGGPVGSGGGGLNGYAKSYNYDDRLANILPPYLFDISNSGWHVSRERCACREERTRRAAARRRVRPAAERRALPPTRRPGGRAVSRARARMAPRQRKWLGTLVTQADGVGCQGCRRPPEIGLRRGASAAAAQARFDWGAGTRTPISGTKTRRR
jgi:hypothetical protein